MAILRVVDVEFREKVRPLTMTETAGEKEFATG